MQQRNVRFPNASLNYIFREHFETLKCTGSKDDYETLVVESSKDRLQ